MIYDVSQSWLVDINTYCNFSKTTVYLNDNSLSLNGYKYLNKINMNTFLFFKVSRLFFSFPLFFFLFFFSFYSLFLFLISIEPMASEEEQWSELK